MLEFFINNAWAQSAAPQGGGGSFILMMVVFIAIFYFMLIRPQTKQAKEHKAMLESLSKGDEIVTSGGMLGRVNKIGDNFIAVEIAQNLEVKIQKQSVTTVLPKGTLKGL